MFGKNYIIDHILSEVSAENKEQAYRIYVTDMLRAILGWTGNKVEVRYADIVNATPDREETRTPEEIIESIKDKLRAVE